MLNRTRVTLSGITYSALLILVVLMWLAALEDYRRHFDSYDGNPDWLWQARLFAILFGGVLMSLTIRQVLRCGAVPTIIRLNNFLPARLFLYTFLITAISTTTLVALELLDVRGFEMTSVTNSILLIILTLWMYFTTRYLSLFSSQAAGVFRFIDVLTINILLTLISSEYVLRQIADHFPSPLIHNPSSTVARIEANRQPGGMGYFNFKLNSLGYNDKEFFVSKSDDLVIALLSDSFGFGIVPYQDNYATVAEQRLAEKLKGNYNRIAVHNFGIPAIGMREYKKILDTEAEIYRPDIVLLAVFVGNDITDFKSSKTIRPSWKAFHTWWVYKLPVRIWMAYTQMDFKGASLNKIPIGNSSNLAPSHLTRPDQDTPTFSDEKYLEIERKRIAVCDTTNRVVSKHYDQFFSSVDEFKSQLGERLAIVIIPDDFQVNSELYRKILAGNEHASNYVRDYPQRQITAYCQNRKIPCLDLLPVMRRANEKNRVYHKNDTHWNARGNAIAGEQIAQFITSFLKTKYSK